MEIEIFSFISSLAENITIGSFEITKYIFGNNIEISIRVSLQHLSDIFFILKYKFLFDTSKQGYPDCKEEDKDQHWSK